ncbi:MAG TPA: arsenate reductase ArsC [Candidatus Udaeobacter sp.]|nr:arsenate reductase ArsC [Candidatus Udaeobacter sp.]
MADKIYNVLFLCTGNSARSVMAEVLLNHWGKGRFRAFSAGSHPTGRIHPFTLDLLNGLKLPTAGLRSKSWDEFALPNAPILDFVFTVCDQAAGEVCPIWPGQPITAHWGFPDPAAFVGPDVEKRALFADVFRQIENRIKIFAALPLEKLDRLAIQRQVRELGAKLGVH